MLARVDPSDEYITSIYMALRSANEFMRGLYSHGLWLRRHEALRLVEHGFQFVANYVQAAYEALFHSRTRFKLAPKLHAFLHILGYMCDALAKSTDWVENPITWSCQGDEDFVGKISSLSLSVAVKTSHTRTMLKYATNVWQHWDDPWQA